MATDTLEIIIKSRATGEGAQKAKGGLDKLKKAATLAASGFAAGFTHAPLRLPWEV